MIEIRWHGRGGQGAFTAAKILGAAAVSEGSFALAFPSFGPERRGAPIQAFTKISASQITDRSTIRFCDYIIFLDETLYSRSAAADLKRGGKILINTSSSEKYQEEGLSILTFDANRISEEILGRPVSNTAMLAVLTVESELVSLHELEEAVALYFSQKLTDKNKRVIDTVAERLGKKHE